MVATMRGLPLKALSGYNQYGEDDGCEEMGFPLSGRNHTMSAHNPDGYGVGSDNVSLMSHFVLLCILT